MNIARTSDVALNKRTINKPCLNKNNRSGSYHLLNPPIKADIQ